MEVDNISFNPIDQLGVYVLGILTLVLILLAWNVLSSLKKRKPFIKNYKVVLITLVASLFSIFIFKVDWNFTGELKDSRITGSLFFVMVGICNLISLILIGFANIIKKIIQ